MNDIQQDKFQQAANLNAQNQEQGSSVNAGPSTPKKVCICSSTDVSQSAATPPSMYKLAKQKHCYGSTDFWKSMYGHSQEIQRSYEKSLNLEEIPGLLTINKVNHKGLNKNKIVCVTNVHDSI